MAASALAGQAQAHSGPRPVNLQTDLLQIAELIELCFGASMDEGGRAYLREMRMLGQPGLINRLFSGVNRLLGGIEQGVVWEEAGRIVGNVSISSANYPPDMGVGCVIANVSVHPDYRRRGIARRLMLAALDSIRRREGQFAILQVEQRNDSALALYEVLGFKAQRVFVRWYRPAAARAPKKLEPMPFITLRQPNEWRSEYDLALRLRPNERGGLSWGRPTHPSLFRASALGTIGHFLSGQSVERWIMRRAEGGEIAASLRAHIAFGSPTRFDLLVDPDFAGQLEHPLLNYGLRRLADQYRSIQMEHPLDDAYVTNLLPELGFERRQTLVHMRRDFA